MSPAIDVLGRQWLRAAVVQAGRVDLFARAGAAVAVFIPFDAERVEQRAEVVQLKREVQPDVLIHGDVALTAFHEPDDGLGPSMAEAAHARGELGLREPPDAAPGADVLGDDLAGESAARLGLPP